MSGLSSRSSLTLEPSLLQNSKKLTRSSGILHTAATHMWSTVAQKTSHYWLHCLMEDYLHFLFQLIASIYISEAGVSITHLYAGQPLYICCHVASFSPQSDGFPVRLQYSLKLLFRLEEINHSMRIMVRYKMMWMT